MPAARWGTVARGTALLAGCAAAIAGAWALTRDLLLPVVGQDVTAVSLDRGLGALWSAALLGCVLWLALGTALTIASRLADELSPAHPATGALSSLARRGSPRLLRRLVVGLLGVAAATGTAGPAPADPADRPTGAGVSGLALPDRTTGTPHRTTGTPGRDDRAPAPVVVVRPGDSLWSIAAARLPPGASDRVVTVAWHRLHHANVGRLGPDPDLILPGVRLDVPALADHPAPDREEPS